MGRANVWIEKRIVDREGECSKAVRVTNRILRQSWLSSDDSDGLRASIFALY